MKSQMLAVACAAGALAAGAAVYPYADGDISNPVNWEGQTLPGTTEACTFARSAGNLTLAKDFTIGSIIQGKSFDVTDLTLNMTANNPTLTLTTPYASNYGTSLFQWPHGLDNRTSTTFRGGTIDCSNQSFHLFFLGNDSSKGYTFTLTNSCALKNCSIMSVGRRGSNARLRVVDGSKLEVGELDLWGVSGTNSVIEVGSGGTITAGKYFSDTLFEAPQRMTGYIDVHDTNSLFNITTATAFLGYDNWNNGLIVRDGGKFKASSAFTIGFHNVASSNNWIRAFNKGIVEIGNVLQIVHNGNRITVSDATLTVASDVYFDGSSNRQTDGNLIEILDGSVATFRNKYFSDCRDNCLLVSNASLTVNGAITLGTKESATGNSIRLAGPNTTFKYLGNYESMLGLNGNMLSHESGFQLWRKSSWVLAKGSTNCTVRVTGAGTEVRNDYGDASNWCEFNFGTGGKGNVLEVSDGALFTANRLFIAGRNNALVVSNATVKAGSYEGATTGYSVWIGQGQNADGNRLVLRGSAPKIRSALEDESKWYNMMIRENGTLRYEIPKEGYPEGHVAIHLRGLAPESAEKAKLEIECAEWAADAGETATELVLFRARDDFGNASWLAGQNLNLPKGVRLFVRGTDLILRRSARGMSVIVR